MTYSYLFYDLETTGLDPGLDRIMQFAGIRTDLNLNPTGDIFNIKIKLNKDALPSLRALLTTGLDIDQKGITEIEFAKQFNTEIATPGTTFIGFNNLRFDDEFIRNLNYRNFFDPYEWHYLNNRSRWDIIDLIRMTRSLRPDGISWPRKEDGTSSTKLTDLTSANGLIHESAHDALSDVQATIAVAQLIKQKQSKLFDFLLQLRIKNKLIEFLKEHQTFVYSSRKYSLDHLNTTVVFLLDIDLENSAMAYVFDLRHDPKEFLDKSPEELNELWNYNPELKRSELPIKGIKLNHCPAVAPMSVLDNSSEKRLKLDLSSIAKHRTFLEDHHQEFKALFRQVLSIRNASPNNSFKLTLNIDKSLYRGFFNNLDRSKLHKVRELSPDSLINIDFQDSRLNELLSIYLYKNYEQPSQKKVWEDYLKHKFFINKEQSLYAIRFKEFEEIEYKNLNKQQQAIFVKLKAYYSTILAEYGS